MRSTQRDERSAVAAGHEIDSDPATAHVRRPVPAAGAQGILALQQLAGNHVVQRALAARPGVIQRHGGSGEVTVEEVPDDERPRSREPVPVPEPSGPLLLTDRPWAEIEQERADRWRPKVEEVPDDERPRSREPVPVPEPSGPLLLTDRPWAEIEQERDPRWQQKIQELSRPEPGAWTWSGDERDDGGRSVPGKMTRRRERTLKPALINKRNRIFDEGVVAGRERELSRIRQAGGVAATAGTLSAAMGADALAQETRAAEDAAAKLPVEQKSATILERFRAVKKDATSYHLSTTKLETLDKRRRELEQAERWAPLSDILDQLNDEAAKLRSYVDALVNNGNRISTLDSTITPAKRKVHLRTVLYAAFEIEVRKPKRDDTKAIAALTTLENEIQAEEDKAAQASARKAAKSAAAAANAAAEAAEAARRQQLRAHGLLPGRYRREAEISTVTRATVGTAGEERDAIIEALDALKDPTQGHGWARKWGEYHGNGEGNLPGIQGAGGYKEYYVRPDGRFVGDMHRAADGRRRLVKSDTTGFVYYSHNHYGDPNGTTLPAFVKVTDA